MMNKLQELLNDAFLWEKWVALCLLHRHLYKSYIDFIDLFYIILFSYSAGIPNELAKFLDT